MVDTILDKIVPLGIRLLSQTISGITGTALPMEGIVNVRKISALANGGRWLSLKTFYQGQSQVEKWIACASSIGCLANTVDV